MKRVILGSTLLLILSAFSTGCSNAIPEMDAETKALVVEYAAGIVEKYDEKHIAKLKEIVPLEETVVSEEENKYQEENAASHQEQSQSDMKSENQENYEAPQENESASPANIEEVLELEGISVQYMGWQTTEVYPDDGEEGSLYFSMNATEGNTFLILSFVLQNVSQEDKTLDTMNSNTRFKIEVNGVSKNALTTMLLNDFAHYHGTVPAGESAEVVLVCEIPKDQEENISSLALYLKNGDKTATISLN